MKAALCIIILLSLIFSLFSCNNATASDGTETPSESQTAASTEATEPPVELVTADGFDYMNVPYLTDGTSITAPKNPDANISNPIFSIAYFNDERISSDFAAEVELSLTLVSARAGLVFNVVKNEDNTHSGYAFTITQSKVTLLSFSTEKNGKVEFTEITQRTIEYAKAHQALKIRIERNGDYLRLYYLDDIDPTLVPWPEIELMPFDFNENGSGIGYIDDGRGATFNDIKIYGADALFDAGLTGSELQYTNPVYGASLADPQIVYWEGKYYCYSTSYSRGFKVFISDDLVNWTDGGVCLEGAWDTDNGRFWAPEVVEKDGKFYMIFSNNDLLGIAVSDSPEGPFIAAEKPLIENAIDGHIFFDDDGRVYLYYVSWVTEYAIFGCELDPSLTSVIEGTETFLIRHELTWERHGEGIAEGPAILKHNGTYYLTYSGSHYTSKYYAVGYATSDSPLGSYTRYTGSPILSMTPTVYGPGHHSFITTPSGEMFIVYHVHQNLEQFNYRIMAIDRIRFSPSAEGIDRLEIYGPTSSPQNYPK